MELLINEKKELYDPKIHTYEYAARNGRLVVIKFLIREGIVDDSMYETMDHAAFMGHLEILKWMHENCSDINKYYTSKIMNAAAQRNQLEVVKWLYENKYDCDTTNILYWADLFDSEETVEWIERVFYANSN